MLPGMLMALFVSEPVIANGTPRTLREAVLEPFREFIGRSGLNQALLILAFIFCYKLGDSMCTALATPFYLDMGYSKTDIGIVAKHAGLWPAVIGGLLGGLWMVEIGINRALWLFGVVQLLSILGFAWLASLGPQANIDVTTLARLALVIGLRGARRRAGHDRFCRLHRALHSSALYRDTVRPVLQPRRRATHLL